MTSLRAPVEPLTTTLITASFKWTLDEYVEAQQIHAASRVRPRVQRAFLGLMVFVFAVNLFFTLTKPLTAHSINETAVVSGVCAFLFGSILFNRQINEWSFQAAWKRLRWRERDVLYRFTPDALFSEDEFSRASVQWKVFVKVTEAQRGFLFYSQANVIHWLPFHAFEDTQDIAQVRQYIVQSEVPFKALPAA